MSGYQLFYGRLKQELRNQWKIIHSIFDWTIIVYLLIPALVFGGIMYYSWWQAPPTWLKGFPIISFAFIGFFLSWQGMIRTYMEEADQLYLLQHKQKVIMMRCLGAIYSSVLLLVKWIIVLLLLLPLTKHFNEWNVNLLITTIFYFFSLNLFISTYRQLMYRYHFWKKWLVISFAVILLSTLTFLAMKQSSMIVLPVIASVLLIFSIRQLYIYQRQYRTFSTDVENEKRNKVKLSSFVLTINPEIHMPKQKPKKRSIILWSRSERIFKRRTPVNGVTELFIKAFLREKTYIFNYFQFLSLTSALIVLSPIWLKWGVFAAFWFFFQEWLRLLFHELIKQNPYLVIEKEKKDYLIQAQGKCRRIFATPGILFLLIVTCITTVIAIIY